MPVTDRPDPRGRQGRDATLGRFGGHETSILKSVLDASPDCIKVIELDGTLSFMNANGICAMEIAGFDVVAGAEWAMLWPEENQDAVLAAVRAAGRGEATRFEAYCPTAKGSPRWWDVSVAPVPGPDGRPSRLMSISRDVTDRVQHRQAIERHERELERLALAQAATLEEKEQLLREKDLLMREVNHRVKNSLALVTSMLNLQGRTEADEKTRGALRRASQRVGTIAQVHERLYKGKQSGKLEIGGYLGALCGDLESSVGEGLGVRVRAECEPLEMDADEATVIGLIVSELVTNAVRHAFAEDGGEVVVSMERHADGEGFCLTVRDDGRGLPEAFDPAASKGLGMRVVSAYARKHGWTLEATSDGGARFCVTAG